MEGYPHESVVGPRNRTAYWVHSMPKLHQTDETLSGIYSWWWRISPDPLPVSACHPMLVQRWVIGLVHQVYSVVLFVF